MRPAGGRTGAGPDGPSGRRGAPSRARRRRNDLILILCLLSAALLAALAVCLSRGRGSGDPDRLCVDISSGGEPFACRALSEDAELVVPCADGGSNTVLIRDGRVSVVAADCPARLCVRHRPISREGESIVCLPHRLVVTVRRSGS